MNKQQIYALLEDKMIKYSELVNIPVEENAEDLVNLSELGWLTTRQIDDEMNKYTGKYIYVRESVLRKLRKANEYLQEALPGSKFEIVYGYRALKIQESLYEKFYSKMEKEFNDEELLKESIHRFIAVPKVSGHPTGGAIDIQILNTELTALKMGTKIWEFVEDSYIFSPFIRRDEWRNRMLLRRIMLSSNFAPFDGEWWHFSYGDKEWAKYYNKPNAIYKQIDFKV